MIDVQRDDERFLGRAQRLEALSRDEIRRGERNARMNAQPPHMRDPSQTLRYGAQSAARRRQRIAARENDLRDFVMRGDIVERAGECFSIERAAFSDSLAAE